MSWLTILHIPDRAALLSQCHRLLRHGGVFYAADFYDNGLRADERRTLAEEVDCHYLPSLDRWVLP